MCKISGPQRKNAKDWFSISLRRPGGSLLTTEGTEDVIVKASGGRATIYSANKSNL